MPSGLAFPQCLLLNKPPAPKSMLRADNFPHVRSSLLFHTVYSATLPLGKCPLFLLPVAPQQSHHNALPTLLCSISVWHSSTNCMKLGLQPLLHPISGGAGGFPLLIICHRSRATASARARRAAQVGAGEGLGSRLPRRVTPLVVSREEAKGEGGRGRLQGRIGDEANYFHLSAAPCQQTCNLKRSQ